MRSHRSRVRSASRSRTQYSSTCCSRSLPSYAASCRWWHSNPPSATGSTSRRGCAAASSISRWCCCRTCRLHRTSGARSYSSPPGNCGRHWITRWRAKSPWLCAAWWRRTWGSRPSRIWCFGRGRTTAGAFAAPGCRTQCRRWISAWPTAVARCSRSPQRRSPRHCARWPRR